MKVMCGKYLVDREWSECKDDIRIRNPFIYLAQDLRWYITDIGKSPRLSYTDMYELLIIFK